MVITNKLIYLQLQKTGSTHITNLLNKLFDCKQYTKHGRIPPFLLEQNKYIIGSVRNPWDWYVSLWAFGCQHNGGFYDRLTSRSITGNYLLMCPFKSILASINEIIKPTRQWQKLYRDHNNPDLFRNWIKLIFNPKRRLDLKEKYGFSPISKHSGFFTYRYIYLYSKDLKNIYSKRHVGTVEKLIEFDKNHNILDDVIHNENLEDDFIRILDKIGCIIDEEKKNIIYSSNKSNISKRSKTKYYYNDETKNLVGKNEQLIIKNILTNSQNDHKKFLIL